jgi:hypothetical protein
MSCYVLLSASAERVTPGAAMLYSEIRGLVANGMSVSEAFSAAIQFGGDGIFLAP